MAHDLVIRNANVVDGTGGTPFAADLAIDGDTISAIGEVDEAAREEIDAAGHAVTPGFIDMHTHMDARSVGTQHSPPSPGMASPLHCLETVASRSHHVVRKTASFLQA